MRLPPLRKRQTKLVVAAAKPQHFSSPQIPVQQKQSKVPSLIAALKQCAISGDLEQGRELHDEAKSSGCDTNVFVANSLINLYTKCGDMPQARQIFDSMPCPTLVSWNTLILGYADNREEHLALEFLDRIQIEGGGCRADDASYVAGFKACSNLAVREDGREVDGKFVKVAALEKTMSLHRRALRGGCLRAMASRNALVDAYCKCGSMVDARGVADRSEDHSVVSWTTLMLGYCDNREEELALSVFFRMEAQGLEPNPLMLLAAIKACAGVAGRERSTKVGDKLLVKLVSLETAMDLHCQAERKNFDEELFVATSLLQAYGKSGSVFDARRVFDAMPCHSAVARNSLIQCYAENGEEPLALELFFRFELDGRESNAATFLAALKACNTLATKEEPTVVDGKLTKVKSLARTIAVESRARRRDIFVWNTMIDTFAKCGSMADARRVFEKMAGHSVVSWTALVLGYAETGDGDLGLEIFEIKMEPLVANPLTFVAALKACISFTNRSGSHRENAARALPDDPKVRHLPREVPGGEEQQQEQRLRKVEAIHRRAVDAGFDSNILVASSLVDLYSRCGRTARAHAVLEEMRHPDTVAWNTMILGYVENDEPREALECFSEMRGRDGYRPNAQTFVTVLKACSKLAAAEKEVAEEEELRKLAAGRGRDIHREAADLGLDRDASVGNSLVELYAKCGSMPDARRVFDSVSASSPSTLAALMVGYAENGDPELALELFFQHCSAEEICYESSSSPLLVAAIKAGSVLASLGVCKAIHSKVVRAGLLDQQREIIVANCLVDAYGKCGSITGAKLLFDSMSQLDTVTWNSIIAVYGRLGGTDTDTALHAFRTMAYEGYRADSITFVAVLAACSHGGLVEAGERYLRDMLLGYGVQPRHEHYVCMVDMLARANQLAAAVQLAQEVDLGRASKAMIWRAVLAGCWKWGNVELGEVAFNALIDLDGRDSSAFTLMANIYGCAQMWEEQFKLEIEMKKLKKCAL